MEGSSLSAHPDESSWQFSQGALVLSFSAHTKCTIPTTDRKHNYIDVAILTVIDLGTICYCYVSMSCVMHPQQLLWTDD